MGMVGSATLEIGDASTLACAARSENTLKRVPADFDAARADVVQGVGAGDMSRVMAVYVPLDDVRAMLNLLAEAREIADAGECAQTHVLTGLSRLAGAAVSIYFLADQLCTSTPMKLIEYLDHGWTEGARRHAQSYYTATSGGEDPLTTSLLRARWRERHVTVRRTDLVANKTWYASTMHNEMHRAVGLDDAIVSIRLPEGAGDGVSALVVKRAAGDRPFSVEERELLHLFRCESDWVFRSTRARAPRAAEAHRGESGAPQHLVDGLTRRQQETLGLLLTDASEKVMAARLGISPHTMHQHVKQLYRKLGVSSRAALMTRAFCDDARRASAPSGRARH
jgi:DNA-binding CsgD family transcriptional regulator